MSLQYFWSLFSSYPGQVVNGLALFFAVAGSWLLLATRLRELRVYARLAGESELEEIGEEASLLDEPTLRINRCFYLFGSATLSAALLLSWFSTRL